MDDVDKDQEALSDITSNASAVGNGRERRMDSRGGEELLARPGTSLSRSMEVGAAILTACSRQAGPISIAGLAESVGMSRSSVHRYVTTLVALGWFEQGPKRLYMLASGVHDVGLAALGLIARQAGSREVLERLRDWTGFTASLAVLDGNRATYVERLAAHGEGQYGADLGLRAGAHVPLHCTAIGKALLASLSDLAFDELLPELVLADAGPLAIRSRRVLRAEIESIDSEQGVAVSVDELAPGVCSVALAVPALMEDRRLALEVNVPLASRDAEHLLSRQIGPFLRAAAKTIAINVAT